MVRLRSGVHIPSPHQQFRQLSPMSDVESEHPSAHVEGSEHDQDAAALLVNPLFAPLAHQQGAGEGGQGAAHQQANQPWGGAPPKDAFVIPKFKGEPAELPHTSSVLSRFTLYFNCQPFFCGPNSWQRRRATLALSAFPAGSAAAVWFEHKLNSINSYDQFVDEFNNRFVSSGADLLTLQEKWQNARQRGVDTVSAFYTFLLKLQSQINSLGGNIDERQLFTRFMYGLQPALLEKLRPHVMIWPAAQRTPNNLKSLAETFAIKSKPAPAINAFAARKNKSKFCYFCKSREHTGDTCPKIAARKAAGTWEDRTRSK